MKQHLDLTHEKKPLIVRSALSSNTIFKGDIKISDTIDTFVDIDLNASEKDKIADEAIKLPPPCCIF